MLFLLSGLFLLRLEARQLFGLLFHEPPRSTRAALADLFPPGSLEPSSQKIADLNRHPRDVFELAEGQQFHIATQAQMVTQFFHLDVGLYEVDFGFTTFDCSDQIFVKIQRAVLHPQCHHKTLRFWELERRCQKPDQQIVGFQKNRRLFHPAPELDKSPGAAAPGPPDRKQKTRKQITETQTSLRRAGHPEP
ncbi:MAG TPA: hypothetical protein PKN04_17025, partial [bacterium]|nr:hypothetical protein [bacterium]